MTTDLTSVKPNAQDDIADLLLDPAIQESLITVLKEMPKLASLLRTFGDFYDLFKSIMSDPSAIDTILVPLGNKIEPLQEKIANARELYQEAKQRSENEETRVSLFALLRLLKDPTVQKNLRLVQAMLTLISERGETQPASS